MQEPLPNPKYTKIRSCIQKKGKKSTLLAFSFSSVSVFGNVLLNLEVSLFPHS
jgi:hypothetical protein